MPRYAATTGLYLPVYALGSLLYALCSTLPGSRHQGTPGMA